MSFSVRIRSCFFKWFLAVLSIAVSGICDELPGFRVAGRFLYDKCGEKVILRGVNKMIVWTDINGASFPEIAKTGANCVRIVWTTDGAVSKFDAAIEKCRDNKMIPIVELHDATGKWDSLSYCVDWWVKPEVVSIIEKHEEYLLVNIANEVGNQVPEDDFKKGYITAVKRMREAGIHVPLIIDAAKWGQDIDILQATGPDIIGEDPDRNLLFSVHMWWPDIYGWNDQKIINEIDESVEMNLPLMVGEFGNTAANCNGIINYKLIIKECQENQIGWLAWSWGPGNSDCEDMDMTEDSKFETLHGWGEEVAVTDPNSLKNTSVIPKFMQNGECEGSQTKRFSVSVLAKGRGTVSMSPNKEMVDSGTTVTFTVTADANNEFQKWSGSADGNENPLALKITENVNLTAVFSDNGPELGKEMVSNGDFESGETTGWTFNPWGDAKGSVSVEDEIAVVEIETAGEFAYNAQLFIKGIDLSDGTKYVVSFKAKADNEYKLSMNIGMKQDPWNTYSGYKEFNVGTEMKTFTFEFDMADTSDRDARIVFDIGTVEGKIYFDDISVKPIGESSVKYNLNRKTPLIPFTVYPAAKGEFTIVSKEKITGAFELINISGKCVGKINPALYLPGSYKLNFGSKISSGTYLIRLVNSEVQYKPQMVNMLK